MSHSSSMTMTIAAAAATTALVAKKPSFFIYMYLVVYLLIDHQRVYSVVHSLAAVDTIWLFPRKRHTHTRTENFHCRIVYLTPKKKKKTKAYTTTKGQKINIFKKTHPNQWNCLKWRAHKREWSPLMKVVSLTRISFLKQRKKTEDNVDNVDFKHSLYAKCVSLKLCFSFSCRRLRCVLFSAD